MTSYEFLDDDNEEFYDLVLVMDFVEMSSAAQCLNLSRNLLNACSSKAVDQLGIMGLIEFVVNLSQVRMVIRYFRKRDTRRSNEASEELTRSRVHHMMYLLAKANAISPIEASNFAGIKESFQNF